MMPALRLARLCAAAYREASGACAGVEWLTVAQDDGSVVVAFSGTKDLGDVLIDVRAYPWPFGPLGWCHRGFAKALVEAWKRELRATLFDLNPLTPIHLTGHSEGAAEATLLAGMLVSHGRAPASLTTFGSPRVGSFALGRLILGAPVTVRRFVSRGDPVPDLPPWWLGFYRHVGNAIEIGEGFDFAPDHPIEAYIEALANFREGRLAAMVFQSG